MSIKVIPIKCDCCGEMSHHFSDKSEWWGKFLLPNEDTICQKCISSRPGYKQEFERVIGVPYPFGRQRMNKDDVKEILEYYFSEQLGIGASDELAQRICDLKQKPDESIRSQCCDILEKYESSTDEEYGFDSMLDDVITKTASIVRDEWRQKAEDLVEARHEITTKELNARHRVEIAGLFEEIRDIFDKMFVPPIEYISRRQLIILWEKLQALKAKYKGVEDER